VFERWFAVLVRTAFGSRRKTIANTLRGTVASEVLVACGIDPGARAEQIPVAAFERLAAATLPPERGPR
jgi:16S rRNA (adenine1518-N6/adenine1519-N6)-dimethyltransferase